MGDAVMATPALQRLREALPDSHITLLTQEKLADLWRHHPSLNTTITVRAGESPWSVARRLRKGAFEAALVLPNSPRAALEAWLARVPQRIGYARPWRTWLLTQPVLPRPGAVRMHKLSAREVSRVIHAAESTRQTTPRASSYAAHHIHDYLHLAAALGANPEPVAPKLEITAAEVQEAIGHAFQGLEKLRGLIHGLFVGFQGFLPLKAFTMHISLAKII